MTHISKQIFFPIINVGGMVLAMSFIGLAMEIGFEEYFIKKYFMAICKNYFVALFLQMFIASPISLFALKAYRAYRK